MIVQNLSDIWRDVRGRMSKTTYNAIHCTKYVFKELNPLFLIYRTKRVGGKSKFSMFKPEPTVKLFLNFPCVVYCYEELRVVGNFMHRILYSHESWFWLGIHNDFRFMHGLEDTIICLKPITARSGIYVQLDYNTGHAIYFWNYIDLWNIGIKSLVTDAKTT